MKKIISIICFICLAVSLHAQNQVKGAVLDTKGEPVVGAVVMLKNNTKTAAITDIEGKYTISVPAGKGNELLVSCIGYLEQTVALAGKAVINVTLEEDKELLDEAVVVGYGSMRRSDLTGSVASVRIEEDKALRSTTFDQMLEGKAAGVQILADNASPDAGVTIRVRGIATFSGNSDPLYVVDGVIINGTSQEVATMADPEGGVNTEEATNGLAGINPADIASLEILKDASATAIYGSQGANGVVLITTKHAMRDKPVIDFNAGISVSQASRKLDILGFDQYVDMLSTCEFSRSDADKALAKIYEDPAGRTGLKVTPVDWQDFVFRTAVSQRYYFSITGSPKGYNYLFSIGYSDTKGIIVSSDSRALTSRLNLSKDITKNFKLSFKTGFGYTDSNLVTGAPKGGTVSSRSSILRSVLSSKPYMSKDAIDDEDDSQADDILYGPYRMINGGTNNSRRFRVTPSLSADWNILKWLRFKSTLGGDFTINQRVKTKTAGLTKGLGNMAGIAETQKVNYNFDNTFTFHNEWENGHSFSFMVGHSVSYSKYTAQSITGWNLPQIRAAEKDINNAIAAYNKYDAYAITESSLMSFFGRGMYNYKDRYVLTATLRFDGSSKFRKSNKWGVFPSFAAAWRITKEPWFNAPVISNAKLRLGWGQVGNQAVNSYMTLPSYEYGLLGNHSVTSGVNVVLFPGIISNPGLKWETSEQINAGLDLSLWKGRLAITVDAYKKDTRDLLQNDKKIAVSSGFSSMATNDGAICNKGLEFTIDAIPVQAGNFEWRIGGNISLNRNLVKDVGTCGSSMEIYLSPEDQTPTRVSYFNGSPLNSSGDTNPINIFISGQPMGLFYGYWFDGVVQKGETGMGFSEGSTRGEGYCKYRDMNGNGYIDENDRVIIGNPNAKFTYGFNTAFSWKRLSLKADFNGATGFDIFNMNNYFDLSPDISINKRVSAYKNAWTSDNASNTNPAIGTMNDPKFSNRFVEDGTFLRLGNVSVSYDVPIRKTARILHGLTLTGSVGNVYTWTKYSGYSPVTNSYGSDVNRMGVEFNSTPLARSYNFDIKFRF